MSAQKSREVPAKDRVPSIVEEWLKQPKMYLTEHLTHRWSWATERSVRRGVRLPSLRKSRNVPLWGVSVVRDEADILPITIDHLFRQGVDALLIADHQSRDGTREYLLQRAASDDRVHVAIDDQQGHFQKEKMTYLARVAWKAGARWIVPFDADELWFAENVSLRQYFERCKANWVIAKTTNCVPLQDGAYSSSSEFLVCQPESASKVALRAHPLALIGPGNHGAARVGTGGDGLHIAHVPYRSVEQVARKYRNGAQALIAAHSEDFEGWHWKAGASMSPSAIEAAWETIRTGGSVPAIGWECESANETIRLLALSSWFSSSEDVAGP